MAVNERSTAYVTITFKDSDGNPVTPTTATYKIHDKVTNTLLQDTLSITPATSVTITIPPEVNRMINSTKKEETKVITVESTYGSGQGINDNFEYSVRNLRYV